MELFTNHIKQNTCQEVIWEVAICSESRLSTKVRVEMIPCLYHQTHNSTGTSFSPEERQSRNLSGLIPHVIETRDTQVMRAMRMINTRSTNIDKYLYLSGLKATDTDLFYTLLINHVEQLMPLVYTPTIGDVCLQYSTLFTRPEALYISIKQRKSIRTILKNWHNPNPSIAVVTDGSRILGLGDLGVNGVGISVR